MGRPKVCHMRFVSPDMLPAHVPRHHWRPPGGSVPRHAVAGSEWGILGIFHSGRHAVTASPSQSRWHPAHHTSGRLRSMPRLPPTPLVVRSGQAGGLLL